MRPLSDSEQKRTREILERISAIPDSEWQHAKEMLIANDYPAGSFLLRAGENPMQSFVLLEGAVRVYYVSRGGREYNRAFLAEGGIAASMRSVIAAEPSHLFIQAMVPVKAVLLRRKFVMQLYARHECWNRLGRISAEAALIALESREALTFESLAERYRKFLQDYAAFPYKIPNYQIASYLGITDVALSRLRKRMNLI